MFDSFHNFKAKLTPAAFKPENKELAAILAAKVIPPNQDNRSYDAAMKSQVTNLLLQGAIPWMAQCFEKYSEHEFHQKLAEGFDFISDWKANHRVRYATFIAGAKVIRSKFYWNSAAIVEGVIEMLKMRGWSVYPTEQAALMRTVETVRTEIYGSSGA